MSSVLEVRALGKAFGGRTIVEDLSFSVDAGEAVALVGANGSGKTTVLRCIVGADAADHGDVLLAGRPFDDTDPDVRRAVCSVLDDMGWFSDVTAAEHLDLLARVHGDLDPLDRVDEALDSLGISHVADQVPLTLSSGQRRRLALATSMVRGFTLLVLDEPEQRLDHDGRAWLAEHLRSVVAGGRAVLLASHDDVLLGALGARRIVLDDEDGR